MIFCLDLKILDVDMYSKKIGLFYKNKEKISSYFGLTLTILYVCISLGIFIFYTSKILKHIDLTVNDSTIYLNEIPSVNLNNSDLLYFAFAVEIPSTAARFIDETIYTVKAIFYDSIKNENGTFEMKELRELQIEKCQQEKFGSDYQHLFTNGEFNNSYCLSQLDFDLTGGFIYENLSLIRLDIYPCKNSTNNSYHCKPQEVIDSFLAGGYFSILLKDIGLNPNNFSYPILPTLQDLYTTISSKFFRDLILYYEITEIKTDSGIFFENIQRKRYLKFDKKIETLFLRDQEKYYNGESIIGIQIRLSDNIHLQSREYKKMHNVFATTGGYMQMINTIFLLLSLIPNKYLYDNLIIGNLFDFDITKNKIINKLFKKNIRFNSQRLRHELESPRSQKSFGSPRRANNILQESRIIYLKSMNNENKEGSINNDYKSEKNKRNINKNYLRSDNSLNLSAYEKINNQSKIEIQPFKNNSNIMNNNKIYSEKNKSKKIVFELKRRENSRMENRSYNFINFKLNLIDYLFMGRFKEKNKTYNLFRKGIVIYKEKLDVINLFNCILFIEKRFNFG
jgi:hypothetical protein